RDKRGVVRLRSADASLRTMTGHFLIDAVRRARTPVTPFRQSMGDLVENFFRPSECVTVVGSFDSLRLTPQSAHDDRAFFDRRSSTGEDARHSIVLFPLLVALGQELSLALFGLGEDGGVDGRFAKLGQQRIGLQVFIAAITVRNRRFHQSRGEGVPSTGVVLYTGTESGFRILEGKHILLDLIQKLV